MGNNLIKKKKACFVRLPSFSTLMCNMRSEISIFICLAGLAFFSKNMIYTSERSVNIIENKPPPKALPTFYSLFFDRFQPTWRIAT